MSLVSYPARQRNRRRARALRYAMVAFAALLLAGAAGGAGVVSLAASALVVAVAFGLRARHWLGLARRSAVGARSEQRIRAQLERLEGEGWTVRHSLNWQGGGDIDHVAIAPPAVGLAFAIETKTRTYAPRDLARITAIAQSLPPGRGVSCGARPILCLAGVSGIERREAGVPIVSADRLVPVLLRLAGTTTKPRFLR